MLTLDVTGALAKAITPSKGIPDQELTGLQTGMKRNIEAWLREREKGEHAWSMDPYDQQTQRQAAQIAAYVRDEKIQTVVWIGIGGSGLGPQVIQEAKEGPNTVEFILIDTLDPAMLRMYLDIIDWKRTFVVVASKSGGTLEPMSLFFLCYDKLKQARGEEANRYAVALTDPHHGALRSFCLEHGIQILHIPVAVGGRFSIFTPIGLLPVALLGGDTKQFLRGAKEMDTLCQKTELEKNPAALLAAVQFLLDTKRNYPLRVIMPYSERLRSFARWDQQLIAESLGKNDRNNPIPLAAIGTQDQHSLLQQWMEGPRMFWHLFIREAKRPEVRVPDIAEESLRHLSGKTFGELLDACYSGTSQALTSAKRPHATITVEQLDEFHLGQLFFLCMAETVLLGKLYRIDPYGQEGVEAGKRITKKILGAE
ncbi:MAG TPA: hypothetical protein VI913_00785 [Candidatus Peribacteraceae bacterium]|nr:hypothetical protein [Candidatus Peribacteraceae bacterium]